MNCDALELKSIEHRIIQVGPRGSGSCARRALPYATVVTGVDIAGAIEKQRVIVGMQAVAVS